MPSSVTSPDTTSRAWLPASKSQRRRRRRNSGGGRRYNYGEEDTPLSRPIVVHSRSNQDLIEITSEINEALRKMGALAGVCHVFVPHTTAGIVVNENADPDVTADMLDWLDATVPQSRPFRHAEGNSPAHIKATLVGQWATIPVEGGRLALGTWQGVFLAEFDGPRDRAVIVNVVTA